MLHFQRALARSLQGAMLFVVMAAIFAASSAVGFTSPASMNGDTCDTTQFSADEVVAVSGSNAAITATTNTSDPSHVIQGKCSIQYHLNGGDTRVENRYGGTVGSTRNILNGNDVWVARWQKTDSTVWAEQGYNVGHHLAMQIKTVDTANGGPFGFEDRGTGGPCPTGVTCWSFNPFETGATGQDISSPVNKGTWEAWLFHFKIDASASVGLVEAWRDGVLQYSQHHAMLETGFDDYYKQGIYQATTITAASTIWIDGTTMASTETAAEQGAWGVASKTPVRGYDTYDEAADTTLASHVPNVGSEWVRNTSWAGLATVNGTDKDLTTADATNSVGYYSFIQPKSADYTVQADVNKRNSADTGWSLVAARMDTTAKSAYTCGLDSGPQWALKKQVAGVTTTLQAVNTAATSGHVSLTVNGTSISCVTPGGTLSATDSSLTGTGQGGVLMRSTTTPNATSGMHVDNYQLSNG